jgi:hypothetical protein
MHGFLSVVEKVIFFVVVIIANGNAGAIVWRR